MSHRDAAGAESRPHPLDRLSEAELGKRADAPPGQSPAAAHPPVSIGYDVEWVTVPRRDGPGYENHILSYQIVLDCEGRRSRLLVRTGGRGREHRLALSTLLGKAFEKARREGMLAAVPNRVTVYGHFLRGDVSALKDFALLRPGLRGIGRTLVSGPAGHAVAVDDDEDEDGPRRGDEDVYVRDRGGQRHKVVVRFLDTQRLIPGGGGLADAARMVGRRKLDLHDDLGVPTGAADEFEALRGLGLEARYGIARMDLVDRDYPDAFERYALEDAEIALEVGLLNARIATEELGLERQPPTIASMAARYLTAHAGGRAPLARLLGREEVKRQRFNERTRKYRTVKTLEPGLAAHVWYALGVEAYHGGRNECFYHGPTPPGRWLDYDLPSAYPTALGGLLELDYDNARQVTVARAFRIDDVGAAWVTFRYPEGTRYPGLPVRGESQALFFPLVGRREDRVVVTPPEIVVALAAGAEVEVIQGVVIPPASDKPIFAPFIRAVDRKRTENPRETEPVKHAFWKEIGNSVYGLTAQGLREKRAFDPATGKSQTLKPSNLTDPFIAGMASGVTRAVLAEILHGMPDRATVVSVTTDGFLTDAALADMRLDGPACTRFAELRHDLFGRSDLLTLKHGAAQLVSVATRATYTARRLTGTPRLDPILAKGGVKLALRRENHNAAMVRLYLTQQPGQQIVHEELISAREQILSDRDLVTITKTRTLNLAYDYKRRPTRPAMVALSPRRSRIAWHSEPWETVTAAERGRERARAWRRSEKRLVLDMEAYRDWEAFEETAASVLEAAARAGRRAPPIGSDGATGLLKRWFLQAGRSGLHGLSFPAKALAPLAERLTALGIPTTKDDLTYARRASRPPLLAHSVPAVPDTLAMLVAILGEYPAFEWRAAFRERDHTAVEEALAARCDAPAGE